jgi:hypothetical protein
MLIGFESLRHDTLQMMNKKLNVVMGDYTKLIDCLHRHSIGLYGTFIFGYDSEISRGCPAHGGGRHRFRPLHRSLQSSAALPRHAFI